MRTSLLYASALLSLGLSCSSQTGSGKKGTLSSKFPSTYSVDELDQLYRRSVFGRGAQGASDTDPRVHLELE